MVLLLPLTVSAAWDSWMAPIYNPPLDEWIVVTEEKELSPKEILRELSVTHGVNYERASTIVDCESWWDVYAKNKYSSARWLAQFMTWDWWKTDKNGKLYRHTSTWTSSSTRYLWYKWDVFNPRENLTVLVLKLKNEWWRAWTASKHCWWK